MMKQTVLITGANSFIAKHLVGILQDRYQLKFLTRNSNSENEYEWNLDNRTIDERALDDVNYIVHLAGAKLNDGTPLTEERKKIIYDSRIGASDFLREKLKKRNQKLDAFISASAIGYYGFTENTLEIDENGAKGRGFSANLSDDWEKAADRFKSDNVADRVVKIRVSLVLGNDGGIFPMYLNMIKADPAIARQPNPGAFPWNHVEDMAGIFAFAVQNPIDGVYNSVAPEPASVQDLLKATANAVTNSDFEISPFRGQHLVSKKIQREGYIFKYPNIEKAVNNITDTIK